MTIWMLIVVLALGTIAMKTLGPLLAGGHTPPAALTRVVSLLAPALITALIVADTITSGRQLTVDARLAGLAAGALALWVRAPTVVALIVAACVCATVRALT